MIAFHKESRSRFGESGGAKSLIRVAKGEAHPLTWLDLSQLTNNCTTTSVSATAYSSAYTEHSNCPLMLTPHDTAGSSDAAGRYDVHGAISEAEPALQYPAPGPDANRLVSRAGFDFLLGVPVTTALYRALQKAQYGNGSACDGSDATNCVPSLTRSQIRALYTQNIFDWDDIKSSTGVSLTAVAGVIAPTDDQVRICRRVASSSTQASFETYFLNERCVANVAGFALPDDASTIDDVVYSPNDFLNGSLINAAPSSDNMHSCLRAANTGNFWGVGVLSTAVTDAKYDSGNGGFRFVAIDGAAPNLANVANGDYDFFSHFTISRISTVYPGNVGSLGDGNPRREVVELIYEAAGKFSITSVLGSSNQQYDSRPWGNGGVLTRLSSTLNTAPYSDVEMANLPINTQTRDGNSCAPARMTKPQPINGTPNP